MAILAAPYIEEKLPAQQGDTLCIPFSLSRAVGENDIFKISLKVKNISTNTVKMLAETNNFIQINNDQYIAYFSIGKDINFLIGQFYKAQIAFISGNEEQNDVGAFSTVGIFKYTKIKSITIADANTKAELEQFKPNSRNFVGQVEFEDITEKISEYKFDIFDSADNLFYTTDYLIHNVDNNQSSTIAFDYFQITKTLKENSTYTIRYTIKTINNLTISSPNYTFIINPEISVVNFFPGTFKIEINNEDGYFSLFTVFNMNKLFSGSFKILRADSEDNFSEWYEIANLSFANKNIFKGQKMDFFKDFTIKQGVVYKYALQQYSGTFFAKKIICQTEWRNGENFEKEDFQINFEDILLFDGKRQLKIKYNPKISSFKNTILESKIDTLGNKYPFFFKNGYVKYKEFPISGLISCLMDENHFFFNKYEEHNQYRESTYSKHNVSYGSSTDLTYDNILKERDFKLEVLEWLNDGKEKLFRSPTEGNYIVRLMNVSLQPMDALGRMLHTFSCTAYECADFNFKNLESLKFIDNKNQLKQDICYNIENLADKKQPAIMPLGIEEKKTINLPKAIFARLYNIKPGSEIILTFVKNKISIVIGYTGWYNIPIQSDNPLVAITFDRLRITSQESKIEYGYLDEKTSHDIFDKDNNKISNFTIENHIEQFTQPENIINVIIKKGQQKDEQLEEMPFIRIQQKLTEEVYYNKQDQKLYFDYDCKKPLQKTIIKTDKKDRQFLLMKTGLYHTLNSDNNKWYYIDNNFDAQEITNPETKYNYTINGREFILNSGRIELDLRGQEITDITLGPGLYADVFYSKSSYEREVKQNEV